MSEQERELAIMTAAVAWGAAKKWGMPRVADMILIGIAMLMEADHDEAAEVSRPPDAPTA